MGRAKKHEEEQGRGGLIGPVVVMLIMCAAVFYVVEGKALPFKLPEHLLKQSTSTVAIVESAATSTIEFMLAISMPYADKDRLYRIRLPERSVQEVTVQAGWRESMLEQKPLQLETRKNEDGVMALTGADGWNVVLRKPNGQFYGSPVLLGMFDEKHAAVEAVVAGDAYTIMSVSRTGEIRSIYTLSLNSRSILMDHGRVWVSTFVPGEGLESPEQGPSDLLHIDGNGTVVTAASEQQVIVWAVPGTGEELAYETEIGDMVAKSSVGTWKGQGRPLVWLDEAHLLMTQGRGVGLLTIQTGAIEPIATLPAQPSRAVLSVGSGL